MANPYFNAAYYLANNPDLAAAGIETAEGAWNHYVLYGADEGRAPAPWFDGAYYLEQNSDLADAGLSGAALFEHFVNYGIGEGRQPSADANVTEETLAEYAQENIDLRVAFDIADVSEITPEQYVQLANHLYAYGYQEGRPGAPFSYEAPEEPEEPEVPGETFSLTAGQDDLTGTDGADLFKANIVQNVVGAQVNSLGSGDEINGGAGYDTLDAKITAGVFQGGSVSMPIQPETNSVELIQLQAVIADINPWGDGYYSNKDQVYVNAKDMVGVKKISSNYSDADLTIMNLTSKGNSHVSDMTVGMEYTGNADSRWGESNLTVLFDQDYLTRNQNSRDGLFYELMNQESWDADDSGSKHLNLIDFPLTEVIFEVDGVEKSLDVRDEMGVISTYAQLVALLNLKLDETYPEYDGKLEFQTGVRFNDTENLRQGTAIELVNSDSELTVSNPSIALDTRKPAGNLYWDFDTLDAIVTRELVSIDVDLEKVGLTGQGGDLVIGSMNKGSYDANEWYDGWYGVDSVTDTVSGIEQFNITVNGTNDKSSWLNEVRSTNNQLREINITSGNGAEGNWANLRVNTVKDILTLDATTFNGDLEIREADITDEIVDKYLNNRAPLADMPEVGADDEEKAFFNYDGGFGNDSLYVDIDGETVADSYAEQLYWGTSFRSFNLNIRGNDGDDEIVVDLLGGVPNTVALEDVEGFEEQTVAWSGVSISGGKGDDYIELDAERVYNEQDEVWEKVDNWSFAVVFDQGTGHMANGADTIVNFTAGEQTFTQEVQALDFAELVNDPANDVVVHAGEWVNLTIDGTVYSHKTEIDLTAEGVAALTADQFHSHLNSNSGAVNGNTTAASKALDSEGYVLSDGGAGVLLVTAPAKDNIANSIGTQGEGDIKTITSYIDNLDSKHHNTAEVAGVRLEGPVADTLVQGGYAQNGNDFLDFSSYNVKGVIWQNFDITAAVETLDAANSGFVHESNGANLVKGDAFIYLHESQHIDGQYDIYYATAGRALNEALVVGVADDPDTAEDEFVPGTDLFSSVAAGEDPYLASFELVGTVAFEDITGYAQQDFHATNFLF